MDTKFHVHVDAKDHFQAFMSDLWFQLIVISLAAFLAFGGYTGYSVYNKLGASSSVLIPNIIANVGMILGIIVAIDLAFVLICRAVSNRRAESCKAYNDIDVSFDQEAIRFDCEGAHLSVLWTAMVGCRETGKAFVFDVNGTGRVLLPKRGMKPEDAEALRTVVLAVSQPVPSEEHAVDETDEDVLDEALAPQEEARDEAADADATVPAAESDAE